MTIHGKVFFLNFAERLKIHQNLHVDYLMKKAGHLILMNQSKFNSTSLVVNMGCSSFIIVFFLSFSNSFFFIKLNFVGKYNCAIRKEVSFKHIPVHVVKENRLLLGPHFYCLDIINIGIRKESSEVKVGLVLCTNL